MSTTMSDVTVRFVPGESMSGRKGSEEGHWYATTEPIAFDGVGRTSEEALWALVIQMLHYWDRHTNAEGGDG